MTDGSANGDVLSNTASGDQDLTFRYLSLILSSHGYRFEPDGEACRDLGLLNGRGDFNLNAYLLSDQYDLPMQVITFRDTDQHEEIGRRGFCEAGLIGTMERVIDHIHTRTETKVDTDRLERAETPLFDLALFRKAWVNACVSNAWEFLIPPSVRLFDDRIEVVSRYRGDSPSSVGGSRAGTCRQSNPVLDRVFDMAGRSGQYDGPETSVFFSNGEARVMIPFAFIPESVLVRRFKEQ